MTLDLNKKPSTTLVTFLLDRSTSMLNCKDATIEAYNAYITGLKEERGDGFKCEFTFLTFSSYGLNRVHLCEPIQNIPRLDHHTYQPAGNTPLIDSCMQTILALEESLAKRSDNPKVVVCFQTDGDENCSSQYSTMQLKTKIEECQGKGWQFNFMGAGLNGYAMAAQYGIHRESVMSYDHRSKGATLQAFMANASNTRSYGIGESINTSYSAGDRLAAGDAFAPADLKVNVDVKVKAPRDEKKAGLDLNRR